MQGGAPLLVDAPPYALRATPPAARRGVNPLLAVCCLPLAGCALRRVANRRPWTSAGLQEARGAWSRRSPRALRAARVFFTALPARSQECGRRRRAVKGVGQQRPPRGRRANSSSLLIAGVGVPSAVLKDDVRGARSKGARPAPLHRAHWATRAELRRLLAKPAQDGLPPSEGVVLGRMANRWLVVRSRPQHRAARLP